MQIEFSGFEWDQGNVEKSLKKHSVTCEEAEEVFLGEPFVYPDEGHSAETEKRYVLFGETKQQKPLLIAFTMRDKSVRVISARPMSRKERSWYAEEKGKSIP